MDIETWYAGVDGAGFVQQFESALEEAEGPNLPLPGPFQYCRLSGPPALPPQPAPTYRLRWMGFGADPEWVEGVPLADLQAAAIAKTYPDVDAVYDAAIGRRATEYASAEAAAREYLGAEVRPEIVSGYITGHARSNPTGQQQTNEWAAQQIIERADAFRWAELQMRNVRFDRQADMRAATTPEELGAAVAEWDGFILRLRSTLGL
jgi:hypothetical protein